MVFVYGSKHARLSCLLTILSLTSFAGSLPAAHAETSSAAPRITDVIDETNLVRLAGQTHPLASPKYDQGAVSDSMPMEHMLLQLQRSPEREMSLAGAIQERQDPHSATYHQWFTAKELGERFGPAQEDVETISRWLTSHGFKVNAVSKNGLTIDLSGTAGQVRETFHTEIHNYLVNGKQHIANASDPEIPAALKSAVAGVVAMHNFRPKPAMSRPKKSFSFNLEGYPQYDESPADLAVIYNVGPLYEQKHPVTGKGQTVVVLEDTDIKTADLDTFRKAFGLSRFSGRFAQIHPGPGCSDPGINGAEIEAAVDAEWAGAVAADAKVELASCADTTTNFGAFIAAQNLLDSDNPPPIMSLSYIECEAGAGPAGNAYVNALWQQAAGEGVSVFVSAGDGGAAGCDDFDLFPTWAIAGIAANGFSSTPYNVATGGTDFLDTAEGTNSEYWSSKDYFPFGLSAKSYVPEMPWNDSCASSVLFQYVGYTDGVTFCNSEIGSSFLDIGAGSGAPSFVYSKPYWQKGTPGMPNDGKRDQPDVSLFAADGVWSHAILFCMSDAAQGGYPCDYKNATDTFYNSAGGTSFTAPQLASIQALINEKAGGPQGNPAPIYYDLAKKEFGTSSSPDKWAISACNATKGNGISSSCIFQDVTVGNNDVPCYGPVDCYAPIPGGYGVLSKSDTRDLEAYPATTGWDFTSGLGSINVANVVNNWP